MSAIACNPAPMMPRGVPQAWTLPVETRIEPGYLAAVLPMRGSYGQHIEATVQLHAALRRSGVTPVGPMFGRYLNDAAQVREDKLRWEVGCPVPPGTTVAPPLELRSFAPQLVASVRARGLFTENSRIWPQFINWTTAHGYQPVDAALEVWTEREDLFGNMVQETELRIPVERVEVIPLLLRYFVCITGLSLYVLFLLSRVRKGPALAPLRGGPLWSLLGATCAVIYFVPLLLDLRYLYGDFLPGPGVRILLEFRSLAAVAGSFVPAVIGHLLFRLMRPQLRAAWAFRAIVILLYAGSALPLLAVLHLAPELFVGADPDIANSARSLVLALLALCMLGAEQPPGQTSAPAARGHHRAERLTYLTLAVIVAGTALAYLLSSLFIVRHIAFTTMMALPIPYLLAAAYFHERAVLLDVVAKRGVRVLATLLAAALYLGYVPGALWSARMGWVGSWILPVSALPFMLVVPWFSTWLGALMDRHWLGRVLSPTEAHRLFVAGVGGAADKEEMLTISEKLLVSIFPAGGPPGLGSMPLT